MLEEATPATGFVYKIAFRGAIGPCRLLAALFASSYTSLYT